MDLERGKNDRRSDMRLRLLESVVENANDGVLVTDASIDEPGPTVVYVNDAFLRQTGYEKHEIMGRTPRVLQGPGTDPHARRAMRHALEAGEPYRGELLNYRKDGTPYQVELSILPVRDRKGRITHWVSVQRDVTKRREAERAALQRARLEAAHDEAERARRRLTATLDAMEDAFFSLDERWRSTFVNAAAERLLGLGREKVAGKRLWKELEHLLGKGPLGTLKRCKDERRVEEAEICAAPSGRCFLLRSWPFEGGVSFFLHEITEQRRAQETERRLMAIIEATPEAISSAELDGRLRYLNPAGYRLLGLPEELQASDLRIPEAHPPWAAELIAKEGIPAAMEKGIWQGETAILRRDGVEVPVSQTLLAHYDSRGGVAYLSTVVRDISGQKQAAEDQRFLVEVGETLGGTLDLGELTRRGARLPLGLLADFSVIALRGDEGGLEHFESAHVDPSQERLLDELVRAPAGGGLPLCLLPAMKARKETVADPVTQAWLAATTPTSTQRRALERLAPRSLIVLPLVAWDATLGAMVLAFSSSARRYGMRELALARELALRLAITLNNSRLYERSLAASRARDEVLAVVSHDLRNPLESVNLASSYIRDRLDDDVDPDLVQSVELIQRSTKRASRLVADLLDATRAEAGQLELDPRDEDPAALGREALELQRETARNKGVTLRAEIEPIERMIRADRHRIMQVLTNLLDNAIRHTPSGGTVTVRVRSSKLGARFAVMDTGEGISPADLPHVFDRFWTATGTRGTGAGLGLPLCKVLVEAHGGGIRAESRLGRGSAFRFFLPWS